MQDIKLYINEYGPIKDAELTFAPMMLFTGNSNLGKSYVNYLWYYFMSAFTPLILTEYVNSKFLFKQETEEFRVRAGEFRKWINDHAESFLQKLLNDNALVCNVNFVFELDDFTIRLERDVKKSKDGALDYAVYKVAVGDGYKSVFPAFFEPDGAVIFAMGNYLQQELFGRLCKAVILPPARGALVGENFSVKDRVSRSSGLYANFMQDYDFSLRSLWGNDNDEQFFNARIKKLLNGELLTKEGVQYLQLPSGRMLPLSAAASSIRELGPLMFFLKNHYDSNVSFCFEEPEAHLHPQMQVEVADMLAICLNKGYMFQITTHSDYLMQRFNQLIKLGRLKEMDEERFEAYTTKHALNRNTYLDCNMVKGYFFYRGEDGGTVKIKDLDIGRDGLPMSTFFDVVARLSEQEHEIDNLINDTNKEDCLC